MGEPMVSIQLPYLVEDVDRHGNVRCYVRMRGLPKVRIRGVPGTEPFMADYHAALAGTGAGKTRKVYAGAKPGSLAALCQGYYGSITFRQLDKSTQAWRRRALDLVCAKFGEGPVALFEESHIRKLRDALIEASGPGAANARLKALKALWAWAVEAGQAPRNPARAVAKVAYVTKGHHSWTLDDVEAFEARHPVGTKARLAMALLLYTACRREDATRLGPQHIRDGRIRFTQGKNEHRNPIHIDIPVYSDLGAVVAATPSGHLTFLVTAMGKPFTVAGFGNWFRDRCDEAGLEHCSAHGLRKALCARMASNGCTTKEIQAISGHMTLEEIEVYTRAAETKHLADRAMQKLESGSRRPPSKN